MPRATKAAERDYQTALAQDPGYPPALHYLGVIHYQRHQLDEALPLLERAVQAAPREPEFHNNLGLALAAAQRASEAVAAFRHALALKPDHAGAWSNLGLALQGRNEVFGAVAAVRAGCSAERDAIQASLGSLQDIPTPLGTFSFDNREPQHPAVVQIVEGGTFTVLD